MVTPSYEEGWGIALAEALYCGAVSVCYELPHYRGIFGDYPAYARVGDVGDFVARFWERRAGRAEAGQREFVKRYADAEVVASLVSHLREFDALPGGGK